MKQINRFRHQLLTVLALLAAFAGISAISAIAGDAPEVAILSPTQMAALASGPAPSLAYIAPPPPLSEAAKNLLSGAAQNYLYGKWRENTETLSQLMASRSEGASKPNAIVGEFAPLIKTLPTVNNRALDLTWAFTESETTVAQPLKNDIVVAYNSSADFAHGGSFSGFAYSLNNGKTFTEVTGGLPDIGSVVPLGDPSLASDGQGNVFYSTLNDDLGTGASYVAVYKSTDGGQSFSPYSIAGGGTSYFLDKPLMAIDTNPTSPHYGNLYFTFTYFSSGATSPIYVCQITVTNPSGACVPIVNEGASGAMPAVDANGNLYVAWEQFTTGGGTTPIDALYFSKSTDGGASFSTPAPIVNVSPIFDSGVSNFTCNRQAIKGAIRVNDFPSIAVDTGAKSKNKGSIYVVWNDQRNGDPDIFITKSTNGGSSWSTPAIVNKNGAGTDQFFPWVTVLPNGKVGVTYYDRSRDQNNWYIDFDLAVSINGGTTWTQSFLTQRPFPVVVNTDPIIAACYMSDYNQISNNGLNLLMAWGDNSNGNPDVRFVKK
jgi:hypothetical protein